MSQEQLGDDLFPTDEIVTERPVAETPPVASGSRSPEPQVETPQSPARSAGSTSPQPPVKRSRPVDPDDEDEDDNDDDGDLFGDDDDEQPDADEKAASPTTRRERRESSASTSPRGSQRQRSEVGSEGRNPLEYEEEDVELQEARAQTWASIAVPKSSRLQPTDGKVWHWKLPAYMKIDSKPYDAEYYRETLGEDEVLDGSQDPKAARRRMLEVKNTIRWKWVTGPDGEPVPQSNARMLRWSDGTMSMQIGSDLFDIAVSNGASLARPEDELQEGPEASSSKNASNTPRNAIADTTYLVVPAREERILVTETSIAGQLSLVPTSMNSKTHMELVKHVGQQHVKHSKMKLLSDHTEASQLNELLLKADGREIVVNGKSAASKKKTSRSAGSGGGASSRKSNGGGFRSRRQTKRDFSDSDDDDDLDSSQKRSGGAGRDDAVDYEEDDGFIVADDDDDEGAEVTEDEDGAAYGSSRKKGKSSKSKSKATKKRKGSDDEDEDEDSLDEMERAERRIEKREREKKRAKKDSGKSSSKAKSRDYVDTDEEEVNADEDAEGEDMDMDVESEDD